MSAKKRSASANKKLKSKVKKLKSKVKKLHSKLDRAEARKDRWKRKAARLERTTAELEAKVKKLKKRLEGTPPTVEPRPSGTTEPEALTDVPTPDVTSTTLDPSSAVGPQLSVSPDASWTVAQLRAEARTRGLTGLSGKSKAQLLAALE